MRIAVCIKQVPSSGNVSVDPATHKLLRDSNEVEVNPSDLNALTAAIELKKRCGGTVDVFTMGPEAARKALATALAMGADEGYLLTDRAFGGSDTLGTAKVLAAGFAKAGPYDLILCGDVSSDGATGQVGPMLAQLLGLPSVCQVKAFESAENGALVVRRSCRANEVRLRCALPCLATVAFGSNVPIRPTLRSQMKANKRALQVLTNDMLCLNAAEVGLGAAKSVVTSTYASETTGQTAKMLAGTPAEVAAQILALIAKEEDDR